jgi:hypothetical protein
MPAKRIKFLFFGKCFLIVAVVAAMSLAVTPGIHAPAHAGDAGAFLGGMLAGHVVSGMVQRDRIRTQAEVEQAEYARQRAATAPAPAAAPSSPQPQSAQQKLQALDKLAAGGYITPEEYKAKKKAILDNM